MDPLALARTCLDGGSRFIQLRAKEETGAEFLDLADKVVAAGREAGALVVINDRIDMAVMSGAGGVHVGQDDLPAREVRRLVGPELVIGLSTHEVPQIDRALTLPITYLAVGPIFATGTKDTGYGPRGLDLVRAAAGRGKPVVAIGGITLATAAQVIEAGAAAVAVISDLLIGDPKDRVRQYLRALA